jgi:DNA-binding NarL/FixJ family response regulator
VLIGDRTRAVVPLDPDDSSAGACILRGRSVVAVACALFEHLWLSGSPWEKPRDQRGLDPTEQERALLQRLCDGETDEQVARKLGVSTRTVGRMVADLMTRLGARSRFQAGAMAVEQGWIGLADLV